MAEEFEYKKRFIAVFDFGLITLARRSDPSWIQDVADILSDVAADIHQKKASLGFGWRNNGFAVHTHRDSNEDFFLICTQICGIAGRFFSLGLPIRGALSWDLLFEWMQGGSYVQFGPAAHQANELICGNALPKLVVSPTLPVRGLDKQFFRDDDIYLDVLDGAFLKDYWDLHHRGASGLHVVRFDSENATELLTSLEREAAPDTQPMYRWLKSFVTRDR